MDIFTIVGIVIALGIICIGLYILLRRDPQEVQGIAQPHSEPQNAVASTLAVSTAAAEQGEQTLQEEQLALDFQAATAVQEQHQLDLDMAADAAPTADSSTALQTGESVYEAHLNEQQRRDSEADITHAEHVITLKVLANPRRALSGDKTLKLLLKYGLRYGELSCFHRHEEPDTDSPLMFSVLRITDFGYAGFDLETLSTEQIHGLAFFMTFPHASALTGFDMMSSIAHLIAQDVGGRIYDENHQEYSSQLKSYWRNHVIDYMEKHSG